MDAQMYTQNSARINGREVAHYLVNTEVGQIHVIQYEKTDLEIVTELVFNDYDKAEKKFSNICKQMLDGKK